MDDFKKSQRAYFIMGMLIVLVVFLLLRFGSSILEKGTIFDEQYIIVPIQEIVNQGWSLETAIDYQETKGPAMIWPYAFFGNLFGDSLNQLRILSIIASTLSAIFLLWFAHIAGCRKWQLVLVAIGWLLLPYNIVFSEIVMGESTYLLLALMTVGAAIWGLNPSPKHLKTYLAPIVYCLFLAIALHSRIHIVAIAVAVCITAWWLQGNKSWPWWLASIIAGCIRIPLWIRWGGLVSSDYQALHGLGFRVESLTYLSAAIVPFAGVFILQTWQKVSARKFILLAFSIGLLLGVFASPSLFVPEVIDFVTPNDRFQGVIATSILLVTTSGALQSIFFGILAGLGLAGLVSMWNLRKKDDVILTIACLSLFFGCLLYAFTRGFVFDRFVLTWAFLLPILWVKYLTKPLLTMQFAVLFAIALRLVTIWLF